MYTEEEAKAVAESANQVPRAYTIGTFIQDPRMPMILGKVVKRLNSTREEVARKSKNGLKRNPWDHLIEHGMISGLINEVSTEGITKAGVKFLEEYVLIVGKKSKLSANERGTMEYIMSEAYQELVKDDKLRADRAKRLEEEAKVEEAKINKKPRKRNPPKPKEDEPVR